MGTIVMTPKGTGRLIKKGDKISVVRLFIDDTEYTFEESLVLAEFQVYLKIFGTDTWHRVSVKANGTIQELMQTIEELKIVQSSTAYVLLYNRSELRDDLFFEKLDIRNNAKILINIRSFRITSLILNRKMEGFLAKMLGKKAQSKINLIHDSTRGLTSTDFDRAVKDVGPTLIIIKSVSGYVFGAYVHDTWGPNTAPGWIKGSPETFLFSFGHIGALKPIKLLHNGNTNGIHIASCGVHLSSDLITFCSHSCTPSVYTIVAPGYDQVTVDSTTLAGTQSWVPELIEVFSVLK